MDNHRRIACADLSVAIPGTPPMRNRLVGPVHCVWFVIFPLTVLSLEEIPLKLSDRFCNFLNLEPMPTPLADKGEIGGTVEFCGGQGVPDTFPPIRVRRSLGFRSSVRGAAARKGF